MNSFLNTKTRITQSGSDISIFTYYVTEEVDLLSSFISNEIKSVNGIQFKENELGINKSGYSDIIISINNKGEMIIQSNSNKTFIINSTGELIMEEIV